MWLGLIGEDVEIKRALKTHNFIVKSPENQMFGLWIA
jgi:hypothetical protein